MTTEGQGVIVTGASRGLGAAISVELARRGVVVGCVSRSGVVPGAVAEPGSLIPYACDVTDMESVLRTVDQFATAAGGIRGLVNNAGVHVEALAIDVDREDLLRLFDVNAVSALRVSQAAHPHLKKSKGVVIGIGSFFDRFGVRGSLAYSASKAALASVNRTLAVEWARDGISVFTVAPGYVLTDLNRAALADPDTRARLKKRIPAGRFGDPAEIGRLVATLMLENAGFLMGETIYVDGGQGVRL